MDIDWTPEQVHDCLAIIEEETDRLHEIVRQLLDSSRLRSDAIVPVIRPLVLVEIVSEAVASLGRGSESITVDVDDRLVVLADAGLLSRSLVNLVSNALKHGEGASEVRLAAAKCEDRVRLHVVDQGPGIPRAERERVFQRFAQLNGRTSGGSDGFGLGLAIADGFVRAMNGSIMVDDTPGGGTTMTVELRAGSDTWLLDVAN